MEIKTNTDGRKALGRGLAALLNTSANTANTLPSPAKSSLVESEIPNEETSARARLLDIEINKIEPNPRQPRKTFNEEKLQELALSLKEQGIIQPIVVKRIGADKYQIVAGERRWRASKLAGLSIVPAIVREESALEVDNDLASLVENIQREELNAIELALAYDRMIKTYLLTQDQMAEKVGVSRVSVANTLRLLKLPHTVQKLIVEGKLSEGHSRALLSLQNEADIALMAEEIVNQKLTVRDVESRVRMKISGHAFVSSNQVAQVGGDIKKPETLVIEDELRQLFGTKVSIRGAGDRGTIEIYYTGNDSMARILHLLRGLKQ